MDFFEKDKKQKFTGHRFCPIFWQMKPGLTKVLYMAYWLLKAFTNPRQLKSAAKLPNRKWGHISATPWCIKTRLWTPFLGGTKHVGHFNTRSRCNNQKCVLANNCWCVCPPQFSPNVLQKTLRENTKILWPLQKKCNHIKVNLCCECLKLCTWHNHIKFPWQLGWAVWPLHSCM